MKGSPKQKEKQIFKTIDIQVQQEIQYYVFQDLANVLGILADTQESIKHFKEQPNHPYIPMALNRLTLQVNLSNGIMFDQQLTHQVNEDHKAFFESAKEEAKSFFEELIQKYKLDTDNEQINKCVKHYLEKNLAKETKFDSIQPPKYQQSQKSEFNQKVVQQIFNGMQHVDQTMNQIAEGKYEKLTKDVILEQTINRAKRARLLLNQNFPQKSSQIEQEHQVPLTQEPQAPEREQHPQDPKTQEPQPHQPQKSQAHHPQDPLPHNPEDPLTHHPQEPQTHQPQEPQTHKPQEPQTHQPQESQAHQPQSAPQTQELLPPQTQEPQIPKTEQIPQLEQPQSQPEGEEEVTDIPEDQGTNKPQENPQPILKEQLNEGEKKQEAPMEIEPQKEKKEQQEPINQGSEKIEVENDIHGEIDVK